MSKSSAGTSKKPYWQNEPKKRVRGCRWKCEWCKAQFHHYNELVAHELVNHEDNGAVKFPGTNRE